MQIERHDGTKEKRFYDSIDSMMEDAEKVVRDSSVKKIIIYPKMRIPKKRRKKND